jgi:hypothetical protein
MDTNQIGLVVQQSFGRYLAVSLIASAPFTILFAQLALAVREIAINSRKEYNSDASDYDLTKWIGTALMYVGIFSLISGVALLIRFL